jgi:hypothetical protein
MMKMVLKFPYKASRGFNILSEAFLIHWQSQACHEGKNHHGDSASRIMVMRIRE